MRGADGRRCEACGAGGNGKKNLLECGGCLASFFCTTSCQRNGWPSHKRICRKRRKGVVKIQARWRGWSSRRRCRTKSGDGGGEVCEKCGKQAPDGKELNVCDGCHLSLFCSRTCQRAAWAEHRVICRQRQRAGTIIQSAWRWWHQKSRVPTYNLTSVLPTVVLLSIAVILPLAGRDMGLSLLGFVALFIFVVLAWHALWSLRGMHWTVMAIQAWTRRRMAQLEKEGGGEEPTNMGRKEKRTASNTSSWTSVGLLAVFVAVLLKYSKSLSLERESSKAEEMFFGHMIENVLAKWAVGQKRTGGFFYTPREGIEPFLLFVHPYDALAYPTSDLPYYHLTGEDVEFVSSNRYEIAAAMKQIDGARVEGLIEQYLERPLKALPGLSGFNEGRGLTSFAYSNGEPASDNWFTWDEATEYISLKAELLQQNYDDASVRNLLRGFRRIISVVKPPYQDLINSGVLSILAWMLSTLEGKERIQIEVARVFNNMPPQSWIATDESEDDEVVVRLTTQSDALEFIRPLSSSHPLIREASAKILDNIAGGSSASRYALLAAGVLQPLAKNMLETKSDPQLMQYMILLTHFCDGEPQPTLEQIAPVLPAVIHLISESASFDARQGAMLMLESISDGGSEYIDAILDVGAADVLVRMLGYSDAMFGSSGLRTVANIAADGKKKAFIDAGFMPKIERLLHHPDGMVRAEASTALFAIVSDRKRSIEHFNTDPMMSNEGLVTKLIDLAVSKVDERHVRRVAISLVELVAEFGTADQVTYIAEIGAIDALCSALDTDVEDHRTYFALSNIVRVGNRQGRDYWSYIIEINCMMDMIHAYLAAYIEGVDFFHDAFGDEGEEPYFAVI